MNLKDSARDALHTNFDRLARQREVDTYLRASILLPSPNYRARI